jgi:hypothetical protein
LRHRVFNQLNLLGNLSFIRRANIAGFITNSFAAASVPILRFARIHAGFTDHTEGSYL